MRVDKCRIIYIPIYNTFVESVEMVDFTKIEWPTIGQGSTGLIASVSTKFSPRKNSKRKCDEKIEYSVSIGNY